MNKISLIGHCVELHDAILNSRAPADKTVNEFCRRRHYLGSRDRRFITDVIYGMLRNFRFLGATVGAAFDLAGTHSPSDGISSVALYAAYASHILKQTSAELMQEIETPWGQHHNDIACDAFVGALSGVDVGASARGDPVRWCALMYSFPDEIVAEWVRRFGADETDTLCRTLNEPALPVLRVNTLKATVEECQRVLRNEGAVVHRTTISPVGLVLDKRINVQALQAFRQGYFEMQDEGSQLISMLVDPHACQVVVDACAGGGGKTLHLASMMADKGTIIAIDDQEVHLNNARQRADRAGASCIQFCASGRDQDRIAPWRGKADAVLVDAPCTGVGTFRRNPWLKIAWSEKLGEQMARKQETILETSSQYVKPGGRLVYATCSLMQQENEDVIEQFLSDNPEFSLLPASEILKKQGIHLDCQSPFLMLLPHHTGTDGFFAAVMARTR